MQQGMDMQEVDQEVLSLAILVQLHTVVEMKLMAQMVEEAVEVETKVRDRVQAMMVVME
jgi:hypothetical protein